MKVSPVQLYTLVEAETCMVILQQGDKLNGRPNMPLVTGKLSDIGEYRVRYAHARERDKTPQEAHKEALQGAKIVGSEDMAKRYN